MSERVKVTSKIPESKRDNSVSRIRKTDSSRSTSSPVDHILFLQRAIGNQAVQKLFKSGVIQAKLRIGQPGDIYEQEADRVADEVMRMPEPGVQRQPEEEEIQTKPLAEQITPLVQRQIEEEEEQEEEEEILQTKVNRSQAPEVGPDLESRIQALRGGGQPLPKPARSFFEPRFGHDFSQVRIHTDGQASESARKLNARAFTVGRDIAFGAGQYSPETASGSRLLAHELTHVVQQTFFNRPDPYMSKSHIRRLSHNIVGKQIQRKKPFRSTYTEEAQPKASSGVFKIFSSAGNVIDIGKQVTYILRQIRHAFISAGTSHKFSWYLYNDKKSYIKHVTMLKHFSKICPFCKVKIPKVPMEIAGPRNSRTWTLRAVYPGAHRIIATISLNGKRLSTLEFLQHVTLSGLSEAYSKLKELAKKHKGKTVEEFGFTDIIAWKVCKDYLHQFKSYFVHSMRKTVKAAASQFDLPEVLVAGVAYIEVGGKDPIKPTVYWIRKNLPFTKTRLKTSLGPMAIQIRRAAEAIGHDPTKLSPKVEEQVYKSLHDPNQAIFIAAKHLSDLRDIDFLGKGAKNLSWNEVVVIGTRYNQGPSKPLSEVKKDLSYGKTIYRRAKQLERLLSEVSVAKPDCSPFEEHIVRPLEESGTSFLKRIEQEIFKRMFPMPF